MSPIWSYQSFKGFLVALLIVGSPFYFSFLSLYYIPKRLRPHPKWSLHTSVGCAFYYLMFRVAEAIRMAPNYAEKPGSLKQRLVIANPTSAGRYKEVLQHPNIKPVSIGGIWFPKAPTPEDIQERTFVLHLPGGAHVVAFSPAQTGQAPGATYAAKLNALTFFTQYRVADTPASRFPAALQDAVTFYSHLLDLGIPSQNILIAGDSAGGNLVLALLRYIEANPGLLPHPRGGIVWAAWVNVTPEGIRAHRESAKNSTDLVPWQILQWGLEAYPPPSSETSAEIDAYISPAQHPFSTSTPLMLQVGTAEVFHDDVQAFARAMADINGNRIRYYETLHAPHNLILCGKILGLQKETEEVVEVAREFFGL